MTAILAEYPEYATTTRLDELRRTEYGYLDEQGHLYLDYTGAGLAARAQHRAHADRLAGGLFGNPHSVNPTSEAATVLVERARARVLAHFNASPDEYATVFTPNATGAARLVGEAYPFGRRTRLVLTVDNHNSVNGLREFARRATRARSSPATRDARGGTVAFNFLDATGKVVDERLVAAETSAAGISLRTGCFCNPGVGEDAFGLDLAALKPLRHAKTGTLDEYLDLIGLPSAGAVRVSFGLVSTVADVTRFVEFAAHTYRDRVTDTAGLPPRDRC